MSLGDRFCDSRMGRTGGGGWVHPEGANSMAMSGLCGRKVLVGTGRAISINFGINGVRKLPSGFVGPPFLAYMARFSATAGCHFSGDLIASSLIGGRGYISYTLSIAEITCVSSFEPSNAREQKLGYV